MVPSPTRREFLGADGVGSLAFTEVGGLVPTNLGIEPFANLTDAIPDRPLASDPADRYDSALEFADALRWAVRE